MEAYARMSLSGLAERIVGRADAHALAELHRRTPFHIGKKEPVTLTGLVNHLRQKARHAGSLLADRAYDLTIDKFSRLPETPREDQGLGDPPAPAASAGPDCRGYFRAFLEHLVESREETEDLTELEREVFEARALGGLVRHHFRLALLEAGRTGQWTRYVWRLPGGQLTVLMPRDIVGRDRHRWLEAHVRDVDASRLWERDRVQAIIDTAFGRRRVARNSGDEPDPVAPVLGSAPPLPGENLHEVSEEGLAETVAQEKAANIHEQRPAIRNLGPERLAEMIRKIFDGITEDGFELALLAEEYGVSKATMTRFTGTQWAARDASEPGVVPDLWRNTARILGSDPDFAEAARQAGVWRRVEEARNERGPGEES